MKTGSRFKLARNYKVLDPLLHRP